MDKDLTCVWKRNKYDELQAIGYLNYCLYSSISSGLGVLFCLMIVGYGSMSSLEGRCLVSSYFWKSEPDSIVVLLHSSLSHHYLFSV